VTSPRDVAKVATVSANGDDLIGKLIAEAVGKVGFEGIIHVEQGSALTTQLEVAEGAEIERGYASGYFVTDPERLVAQLDDPYVLLTAQKITQVQPLIPLLEKVAKTGRSLLVVADLQGEALSLLVVNKLQGTLKVCAIMPPFYGNTRDDALADLAAQLGARVIGEPPNITLADVRLEDLGRAKKIVIDQEKTTIVGGHTDKAALDARVQQIDALYADTNSPFRHQQLEQRLRRMVGGAAVIRVGGTTDAETRERKLRIEDALFATRAAIAEGIVPGGGVALVRAAAALAKPDKELSEEHAAGVAIVRRACDEPCRQIAQNAGRDPSVILARVREAKGSHGYNAARDKLEDLLAAGVVDPTMVVRLALQNAASIAGLLLSSEALIVDAPREASDHVVNGSGQDALSVEPFLSSRNRRPSGGIG
jgi:chaperonin GroEL